MVKVKLGKHAYSFHDPVSGLQLAPGEVKELPAGRQSWVLKNALRGGHIVKVALSIKAPEKKIDPPVLSRAEKLESLTRDNIMAEFDFLDEDHVVEAKKLGTKKLLVEFLLEIEKEYGE